MESQVRMHLKELNSKSDALTGILLNLEETRSFLVFSASRLFERIL